MVVDKRTAKQGFSRRLGEALTRAGVADDQNRRKWVSKTFGVSVESARKWLVGEVMPDTARIEGIAKELGVGGNWLLTGHPDAPERQRVREAPPAYKTDWENAREADKLLAALQSAHKRGALSVPVINALSTLLEAAAPRA